MQEKPASISQHSLIGGDEDILYVADYLNADRAVALQRVLAEQVVWQQEQLRLYGRSITVPRQVAWCGDRGVEYRYSGCSHIAQGWLPELQTLAAELGELLQLPFNFALLNRYRSGQDYMGWHADNEAGVSGCIASISLGASRGFLLRTAGDRRSRCLQLDHGSLLVFAPEVRHCLPKRKSSSERFNITFRSVQPPRHLT